MSRKRKRSRLDTRTVPSSVNEPEVDSFGAVIQSGDGPGREACPFLPRFLLLNVIFGHCPFSGLEPNQSRLQGNLLQEGLDPVTENCALGKGNPTHSGS